jgi:nicotinamidase-related amidase
MILSGALFAGDGTVIDQWSQVKAPAVVDPMPVKIDPSVTALLILDIEQRTVPPRPRAIAAVPKIQKLLAWARSSNVLVAYSITGLSTPDAILPEVKQKDGELVVKASVDKYFKTDLEKHLKDKKITTVIITGTAAEGAVLGTMIGSVMRGFKVILPVDGMPSSELYAEQYVVWHALNAPATKGNVTVTRSDLISVK